jgi:hypothetical protein
MTSYMIMSRRLGLAVGSVVSESKMPAGCNIPVLLEAGLIARFEEPKPSKTTKFNTPVNPEPESAEMPEEQD